MINLIFETRMPCSQQKLWEFHSSSEAIHQLCPPLTKVKLTGELKVINGAKLQVTSWILGVLRQEWAVELSNVNPPTGFTDRASKSPFKQWSHNHIFAGDDNGSTLRDELFFTAHGGTIGRLVSIVVLTILFKYRHSRTKALVKR
ncbi:MAG: hypothetical protein WCK51_02750 [Armatimonadota bacterium]